MELEASLPPIDVRLNATVRQYAFRVAKLAPNHPINTWTTTNLRLPYDSLKLVQLERIKSSIQGLVNENALEPIRHFHFAPWSKDTPFRVVIPKLTKEDAAKTHNDTIRLARATNTTFVYTDASSGPEATGIGVGLVSYDLSQEHPRITTQKITNIGDEQLVYNGELEGDHPRRRIY